MNKVRVGSKYIYDSVVFDMLNPPFGEIEHILHVGDTVKVINKFGCPPANTMGMCYISKDDKFVGMVMTNSLRK